MGLGSDVGTMGVLHGEGEVGSTTGSCRPLRAEGALENPGAIFSLSPAFRHALWPAESTYEQTFCIGLAELGDLTMPKWFCGQGR